MARICVRAAAAAMTVLPVPSNATKIEEEKYQWPFVVARMPVITLD